MSANCALCLENFSFFRRSSACKLCSKTVCNKCIKGSKCLSCLNADLTVRGYDEVPKNLYRNQSGEANVNELTSALSKLPPPTVSSKQAYHDGKIIENDIEQRLAQLRDDYEPKPKRQPVIRVMSVSDPDIDEEQAVKRIIEQTVAEVNMETNTQNRLSNEDDTMSSADKELEERLNKLKSEDIAPIVPSKHKWSWQIAEEETKKREEEEMARWCCICNDNGHVKCRDCDDDVFCNRCFKEQHGRNNIEQHQTVKI